MTVLEILQIICGIVILLLLPKLIKTINFTNPISVDSFSKLKVKHKPELGILFYWFGIDPTIPDKFYIKCRKELEKLCPSNPPLSEEVYAFAFEKYTGVSPFKFRWWGWIIVITIIVCFAVFNLPSGACNKLT